MHLSQITSKLWNYVPDTNEPDTRARASLLNKILVISVIGLVSIYPIGLLQRTLLTGADGFFYFHNSIASIAALSIVLSLASFGLNRNGNYSNAARVFVAGVLLSTVVLAAGPMLINTFYLLVGIFLAGTLLSGRETSMSAVVVFIIAVILAVMRGDAKQEITVFAPMYYFIIMIPIMLTYMHHIRILEGQRRLALEEANKQLQASEADLERRVRERTRDLRVAANVSLQITTQLDSAQLLADVVEQTSTAFGLYHVSIFLYDEDTQVLRLKQGVGTVGDQMVAAGKQFHLDDRGIVPSSAQTQQSTLSNDVTQNPDYFTNPLLPETRSELAIPMMSRGQLIGVLDLQSEQVNRFDEQDMRIMRTLADQIAVAVLNSQLFDDTKAAKETAEKADHVKSAFLASMSHELRTPLNAIINFSKFLNKGIPGPVNEEQEQLIDSITDSGQHLLNLINDVLDMSKIEAGSLKLYVEQGIDFSEIVDMAAKYTQPLLADKPVTFVKDIPDDLPSITGDRKRLLQILMNILSNACKFTEEGQVSIRVQDEHDHLLVAVSDTGAGIAPEDEEHVFTAFKQTERGLQQGGGGTGLGMPICKKLVEAHEGKLWFESKPGKGTTFFVRLPMQAQSPQTFVRSEQSA